MSILTIVLSAIFTDNFVLSKFMGCCPFLGVSKKISASVGMGCAVIFVMLSSTAITYPIYVRFLAPHGLAYLQTMAFILIIAVFVQLIELVLRKAIPPLYKALGVYLPLITTNCAVLGVTLLNIDYFAESSNFWIGYGKALLYAFCAGLGFLLAMVIFAGIRERLEGSDIPTFFKGIPSTLIAASIVSLSFLAFSGMTT